MQVSIDAERCQGHGRCVVICPGVFTSDDDAHGVVLVAEPPAELQAAVRRAAANCPEQAVLVTETA